MASAATTTRRAALKLAGTVLAYGSGAAAFAVATTATSSCTAKAATTATSPGQWQAALTEYETRRAFSDSLATNDPRADEAVDAYCTAMDALVENVPAPNGDALVYKMELARERWDGFSLPDEWLDAYIADTRRLLSVRGA